MTCNICGQEIQEPWICPSCGENICDDCMVDVGTAPDDVEYICRDCFQKEREARRG